MQATQKAKTRRVDDPTMTDFNFSLYMGFINKIEVQ